MIDRRIDPSALIRKLSPIALAAANVSRLTWFIAGSQRGLIVHGGTAADRGGAAHPALRVIRVFVVCNPQKNADFSCNFGWILPK
jgi:hypothetical protein